jgi:hypothetical protein
VKANLVEAFRLEIFSTIASAVFGGLIAGFISLLAQVFYLSHDRDQRFEERRRKTRMHINSVMFKIGQMYSDVVFVKEYLDEAFQKEYPETVGVWSVLRPIGNPPEACDLSSEEKSEALEVLDMESFRLLIDLSVKHKSVCSLLRLYNDKNVQLKEKLEVHGEEGITFSTFSDRNEFLQLRPYMVELNGLASNINEMINDCTKIGMDLIDHANPFFYEITGRRINIKEEYKYN